ncbi:hypothetical protein BZA77DRAFT_326067 [Pyronema omphalodes]|nr:hypothetical protein BZA77DRAFT_326067 [Pyronema omphalodes]
MLMLMLMLMLYSTALASVSADTRDSPYCGTTFSNLLIMYIHTREIVRLPYWVYRTETRREKISCRVELCTDTDTDVVKSSCLTTTRYSFVVEE